MQPSSTATLVTSLSLLTLTACGHSASSQSRADPSNVAFGPSNAIVRRSPPCEEDDRCVVVARHDAGRDARGVALRTWETTTAPAPVDDTTDERAAGYGGGCTRHDFWLEREGTYELTLSLCNDGYGASGVGEDDVRFEDGRLHHAQSGGSAWRWSTTVTAQLSPRRVLRVDDSGYWAVGANVEERTLDYARFVGAVEWYAPRCVEDEDESWGAERDEELEIGVIPPGEARRFVMLPVVAMDATFDPARVDARACATRVDGTTGHGFMLAGEASATDASLDVIAGADGTVTILVHDDAFVQARSPRASSPGVVPGGDRLVVHVGEATPSYYEHCIDPAATYGTVELDAVSGQVLEGDAASLGLVAIRAGEAPGGRFITFKLGDEELRGGLTIAYADADAVGETPRSIATSELRAGDAWSLGRRERGIVGQLRCDVVQGALVRTQIDAPITFVGED